MKLKLFMLLFVVVLCADVYQSIYLKTNEFNDFSSYGDSIGTFGFSNKRQNTLSSDLNVRYRFDEVLKDKFKDKEILRGQPLFISAKAWLKFTGKKSYGRIILPSKYSLFFVDPKTLDVIEKKFNGRKLYQNTGVIDFDKGRMYFVNHEGVSVFSIDGKLLEEKVLDWESIIKNNHPGYSGRGAFCSSALSLFNADLFWACSGKNFDFNKGAGAYGDISGGSGFVVKLKLDESGLFAKKIPEFFFTNKKTDTPMTGYNGGIWLAGGGLSFDKEKGAIVSVIGNGPYIPKEQNYSCSAFKIHNSNITSLYKENENDYGYVGSTLEGIHECMFVNYEWASGQVALVENNNTMNGFVAGKLGRVYAFDARIMNGDKVYKLPQIDINTSPKPSRGMDNYGSLAVFKGREELNIMHVGLTDQPFYMNYTGSDSVFEKIKSMDMLNLDPGLLPRQERTCLGLALKSGSKSDRAIEYLYSGPYYKHSFITDKESTLYKKLTSFGPKPYIFNKVYDSLDRFQPIFYHHTTQGYFFTNKSKIPKGYRLKDVDVERWRGHLHLDSYSEKVYLDLKEKASLYYKSTNRNFLIVNEEDEYNCETKDPNLVPIYMLYFEGPGNTTNLNGWQLQMISYKNQKFKKRKVYEHRFSSSMPLRTSVSSSLMTYDKDKNPQFAFVPLRIKGNNSTGVIDIVDLKKGKLLQRLRLRAPMKFSLPVLIGDMLVVTSDAGNLRGPVHFFKAHIDSWNKWLANSWFSFLW